MSATTKDLIKRLIKIDLAIRKNEGAVKQLREEREPLEKQLLVKFQNGEIQNMKVAGSMVYLHRALWAGAVEEGKEALHAVMKTIEGVKEMVKETVNSQTFSAWVRERIDEHFGEDAKKKSVDDLKSALPVELQPVVNISEKYSLKTRKG